MEGRNDGARRQAVGDDGADADASACDAVIFVPSPSAWQRDGTPGGLALLDRQLRQLGKLGIQEVLVLVPDAQPGPVLSLPSVATRVARVPAGTSSLWAALAAAPHLPEACLALSADRLVDWRVLLALRDAGGPTTFASSDGLRVEPIGWVRADDVARFGAAIGERAERCLLARLDPYHPELRGAAEPYVLTAASAPERERAWRVLLDHVQKRALDLPGRYFDTPFENALVRRLAPTDVTPNQITLVTLLVAAVVAGLFHAGWLRVGVVLALVVGVLDGVDGKLARLKFATSKLGELEHVGDFFYENAWYLSLASHFARVTQRASCWYAGMALVACDLVDSLLYLVVQRRTGRMLDELTGFDRRFRAIAGRRNVYVMIFVAGFFGGRPFGAFACAVGWAAVTVVVHACRVAWVIATTPRGVRRA